MISSAEGSHFLPSKPVVVLTSKRVPTESGAFPAESLFAGVAFIFSLSQATDEAEKRPSAI